MSADLLRRAAQTLRGGVAATLQLDPSEIDRSLPAYMHPRVALALADWLTSWADHLSVWEGDTRPVCDAGSPSDGSCTEAAQAVARAILGEQP